MRELRLITGVTVATALDTCSRETTVLLVGAVHERRVPRRSHGSSSLCFGGSAEEAGAVVRER